MNRFLILLILLVTFTSLSAQNFEKDYILVKNKGKIPKDILTSSSIKYKSKKKHVSKHSKNKAKRTSENSFYLSNSFVIDELLHSGKVNFSDPITKYVGRVADKLLENNKSLRRKLKFYTIRSAAPNAFATDRGIIFVTLGLLAKLENEAQLAFILSHEIGHYTKKHNLKTKISFDEIERGKKKRLSFNRSSNSYDALLKKSNYSKKLELEADKLGMKRFLKTKWDTSAMKGAFDVLEYAHIPFSDIEVKEDFLNTENLTLPEKYFLKEVADIEPLSDNGDYEFDEEDENENENKKTEKYSTHPGMEERRKNAIKALKKSNSKGNKKFIVSEKDFKIAQKRAQFEICNVLIQNRSYPAAIYHSYALQQEFPDNQYLKRINVYALYAIAQYLNLERDILPSENDIQGSMQQVYHVFEKLSARDINLIAARHIWDYQKEHPKDKAMELMLHDEVEDLVIYQLDNPKTFFSSSKMKSKKTKYFARQAFKGIISDKIFKKMLRDGKKYKKKFEENKLHPKKHEFYALGEKKIVYLNPKDIFLNKDGVDYLASEKKQKGFKQIIKNTSQKVGLKTTILDSHKLSRKAGIEQFNDILLLKRWSDEALLHNMYMINSNYNEVQPLIKKYKSKNIVIGGNITLKEKPKYLRAILNWRLIPPFTPLTVPRFMNKYYGLVYTIVLDLETNEIKMREVNEYYQKDKPDIVGMNLYWALKQIRIKKKK